MIEETKMTGMKFDDEKSRVDLIPAQVIFNEGDVFRYGAKKYGEDNWRGGIGFRRLIGATMRHVLAFSKGELRDPESGLLHTAHARACLAMLEESHVLGLGKDDRNTHEVSVGLASDVPASTRPDATGGEGGCGS